MDDREQRIRRTIRASERAVAVTARSAGAFIGEVAGVCRASGVPIAPVLTWHVAGLLATLAVKDGEDLDQMLSAVRTSARDMLRKHLAREGN